MQLENRAVGYHIIHIGLPFFIFMLTCRLCVSEKFRYASNVNCDRYSLDAVYHEKYKPITNNIFADSKEFITRVADLVADNLITIMAELPDKDVSDNEEKKLHSQFKHVKNAFTIKTKKMQKNITSSWEDLMVSNFNLMIDSGNSSLEEFLNKTVGMSDSYSEARKILDSSLSSFIGFLKNTVRDGLAGIKTASQNVIQKEEEEKKKNGTETASTEGGNQSKSKDDILREKMIEVAKMIVPGFLGNITVSVIEKNIDLTKESGIKPEDRDSVLDDIEFDMLMVRNRIRSIIQTDFSRDKGATDLARRSIYTYWADLADEMYKERLRSSKDANKAYASSRLYYRNLWKDEEQIMETLLDLMEVFP